MTIIFFAKLLARSRAMYNVTRNYVVTGHLEPKWVIMFMGNVTGVFGARIFIFFCKFLKVILSVSFNANIQKHVTSCELTNQIGGQDSGKKVTLKTNWRKHCFLDVQMQMNHKRRVNLLSL